MVLRLKAQAEERHRTGTIVHLSTHQDSSNIVHRQILPQHVSAYMGLGRAAVCAQDEGLEDGFDVFGFGGKEHEEG